MPHIISQLLIKCQSFGLRLFSEIYYANIQLVSPESRNLVWKNTVIRKPKKGLRVSTGPECLHKGPWGSPG